MLIFGIDRLALQMSKRLVVMDTLTRNDAIVVLGSGMMPDGSHSEDSLRRTIYGIQLYKRNYAPKIIFTGGGGSLPPAEQMKLLAIEMGVPTEDIIVEAEAANTYENAWYVRQIFDRENWNTALVITSSLHSKRAVMTFQKLEFDVCSAPVLSSEQYPRNLGDHWYLLDTVAHEYLGWLYYWWKDRI